MHGPMTLHRISNSGTHLGNLLLGRGFFQSFGRTAIDTHLLLSRHLTGSSRHGGGPIIPADSIPRRRGLTGAMTRLVFFRKTSLVEALGDHGPTVSTCVSIEYGCKTVCRKV